ncbi:hypothetical protein J3R30DRAFT_3434010 [Lentinula aciculospora]|uniref:Uncharacterized protein n=1 Tax=Lentinula aciculospora TaxID=153920 RepID=A0A9W9DWD2_9AGAR|nr:hypothetical protein J3R30DRAFT_3434010 [Lentinula aciculospora]
MDVDPLAESNPPRYAIESDEEDEYNPLQTSSSEALSPLEIKIAGDMPSNHPLILASGNSGKYWAKGCSLGKQTGAVYVDEIQVGLIFNPSWTKSTIIMSETFARLPIAYMHSYVEKLIKELKPLIIALLDTYPTPIYVSPQPIALQDAPIRYLCTHQVDPTIASSVERFAPPNFLHSTTSAALLSYVASSVSSSAFKTTLLLLPFPRIPARAPKSLGRSDFSHLSEDEYQWSGNMMNVVQKLMFIAVGEKSDESAWHLPVNSNNIQSAVDVPARAKVPVDSGMYI